MDVVEIRQVGRELGRFVSEFDDCFGRCDTASYLKVYVSGQNSNLQRKSVEPIALQAGLPPRSLQAFLSLLEWDEQRMGQRVQEIVMRDHASPWAIGSVDETGSPKKGNHTAGVDRQWCGRLGKVDNCVVSVHTGYTAGEFHCLLDGELFLPRSWTEDKARREEVGIPEEVVYRTKPQIALEQIRRALANGVRVAAWTADEHYGQSYAFLDGLEALGQTYVVEVPVDFCGWAVSPPLVHRATPAECRQGGRKRKHPRLAKSAPPVSEVRKLLRYSPALRDQPWTAIEIKQGEKGPLVREVKMIPFWMRRKGLPTRPHWLIVGRDPEKPEEVKYFVSNAPAGDPLEWLVYVAYSRWPIEQCFQEDKDELGFDHFEVRGWRAIHRHMSLTLVSHLFLNRMHVRLTKQELAQEEAGLFFPAGRRRRSAPLPGGKPDGRSNPVCRRSLVGSVGRRSTRPAAAMGKGRPNDQLHAMAQYISQAISHEKEDQQTASLWH
jgi:SRSO17 transposase